MFNMQLRITKHSDKPNTLLYERDDGTETWMGADEFFVRHDLSHYALEKSLGYTTAFMGMLNKGMEVKDFEDRQKRKSLLLTDEAVYAENMANLFLMELVQGEVPDFNVLVAEAFVRMGTAYPPPRLTPGQLSRIRNLLRRLLEEWRRLPTGQTMSLLF